MINWNFHSESLKKKNKTEQILDFLQNYCRNASKGSKYYIFRRNPWKHGTTLNEFSQGIVTKWQILKIKTNQPFKCQKKSVCVCVFFLGGKKMQQICILGGSKIKIVAYLWLPKNAYCFWIYCWQCKYFCMCHFSKIYWETGMFCSMWQIEWFVCLA